MKCSHSLVSIALVAVLGTAAAHAQDGAPSFSELAKDGKFLKRSDIPKDNEALKTLRAHFPDADTNHDGKLDQGEYEAYIQKDSPAAPQQQRR